MIKNRIEYLDYSKINRSKFIITKTLYEDVIHNIKTIKRPFSHKQKCTDEFLRIVEIMVHECAVRISKIRRNCTCYSHDMQGYFISPSGLDSYIYKDNLLSRTDVLRFVKFNRYVSSHTISNSKDVEFYKIYCSNRRAYIVKQINMFKICTTEHMEDFGKCICKLTRNKELYTSEIFVPLGKRMNRIFLNENEIMRYTSCDSTTQTMMKIHKALQLIRFI